MPLRLSLLSVALGLLLATGCGPAKLNESKKYSIGAAEAQVLDLPAITSAQKITVEFTSSAADIDVYLIKDFKDDDGKFVAPTPAQTLDKKQGKSGSLVVDVPANTATRVVIRGAHEKTDVTLNVANSK